MSVSIAEYLISIGFPRIGWRSFRNSPRHRPRHKQASKNCDLQPRRQPWPCFAATAKMSDDLDRLYFVSKRVRDGADNLAAFGYAATQVGISVSTANSSVEQFASNLRRMPGLQGLLRNMGVDPNQPASQAITGLHAALEKRFPNQLYTQFALRRSIWRRREDVSPVRGYG